MITPVIDAAFGRTRTVMSTLALILIMGAVAWRMIPKESSPDIDIPMIYVSAMLEGVSPEDAERLILRPLEQELASIEGVEEMRSMGYTGGGNVVLEFDVGFDKDEAKDDVQDAVDRAISDLPAMDHDPTVNEINFSLFPILLVSLSGDLPERTLVKLARDLQDRLEAIPTVLEANIGGDREEIVELIVDPLLVESYGLNGAEILQLFARSNMLVAAGNLDTGAGRFAIEVPGLFETIVDVMDMPIRTNGESVIRVKDVAKIHRTFKDPETFARINGRSAVTLSIVKRTGENIIETIEAVKEAVAEEQEKWPSSVRVAFTLDESKNIRDMLSDLQNNVVSAIILVMVVVVGALGLRAAGLVGVSIPGSFLGGVLILYFMGFTLNIVVLFSLIMSVGMLVDGAIVVTEYADRKMAEGYHRKEAYALAAKRMAWPIIASTATTLAAFAPLLFWPGLPGEFMSYMPLTLICVLCASLFMALVFVPVLGGLVGKAGAASDPETMKMLSMAETGDLNEIKGLTGSYVRLLDRALRIPGLVLLGAVVMLVSVMVLYGYWGKGVEFFPEVEPDVASVLVHARGNLSIHEKNELVREVEERVFKVEGVKVFNTSVGADQRGNDEIAEDVIGQVQLEFEDWDKRKKASEILDEIRALTKDIAGIHVETRKQEGGPPTGKAAQIELRSQLPDSLPPMVSLIYEAFDDVGDFIDMEDNRPLPGIQWELQVDRAQASKFGVDIATIGNYVRMITYGWKVADYRPDDSEDEIDIVIRHSDMMRTIDQLDRVQIETAKGSVPISNFVKRVAKPAVGTVTRVDQKRSITVKADLPDGINTDAKVKEIKKWLKNNKDRLDPNVDIVFKGQDEEQKKSQTFLMQAFGVALFAMLIILVTQFNSFYSAFLILTAVIMSTIGVMIGLLLMGQPFGIVMSGVGVISLAGIIVNNNIVLIDTFDYLKAEGKLDIRECILRTGAQRLRPVLLTTITTILGLMPMVLQMNIDFFGRDVSFGAPSTQWWVQLSSAIAFGLSFSTVLTLIVTPCALILPESLRRQYKKLKGEKPKEKKA